ncbi:MAG: hypothetical protein AMXMBFR34_20730 [Myxococcaceae bacterium]
MLPQTKRAVRLQPDAEKRSAAPASAGKSRVVDFMVTKALWERDSAVWDDGATLRPFPALATSLATGLPTWAYMAVAEEPLGGLEEGAREGARNRLAEWGPAGPVVLRAARVR